MRQGAALSKTLLAIALATAWPMALVAHPQLNHASDMPAHGVHARDRAFLQQAANEGAAEVLLAQVALKQASSPSVRQLAQQLLDDHMQIDRELVRLTNLKQDAQPAMPPPAANQKRTQLQGLHGPAFDRGYVDDVIDSRQRALAAFGAAARDSLDPDVKQFAQNRLPMLQHQLMLAKAIAGSR
ncbi:MAG TPA: DUF4142 domain-containing protein [Dyella sp.]|uniref:DUF4142 domain-containing protein n=1 Tax=Dyella sp. TaxID=1869338 RepID=UPI002F951C42